jgi:hypothetical protein
MALMLACPIDMVLGAPDGLGVLFDGVETIQLPIIPPADVIEAILTVRGVGYVFARQQD